MCKLCVQIAEKIKMKTKFCAIDKAVFWKSFKRPPTQISYNIGKSAKNPARKVLDFSMFQLICVFSYNKYEK